MSPTGVTPAAPGVERSTVEMCDGTAAELVRLSAGTLTASVLSFGATLVGLEASGADGEPGNCVLTLADLGQLADPAVNPHLCGIVGPYANRIAGASFDLDGVTYPLEANEGPNTLHGGSTPWDRRPWEIASLHAGGTEAAVTLTLIDPDGEGGFPGRVEATATYSLAAEGTLTLQIVCTTDRATVLAPTNHTYWNLSGSGTIADHRVSLSADLVLDLGPGQIPTGEGAVCCRRAVGPAQRRATGRPPGLARAGGPRRLRQHVSRRRRGRGRVAAGGPPGRPGQWPDDGDAQRPAGGAGVHRQPPRRSARPTRIAGSPRGRLPGGRAGAQRTQHGDDRGPRRPDPRRRHPPPGPHLPLADQLATWLTCPWSIAVIRVILGV
ncbi:MAG: hypothetical protein IPH81_10395 [Candidatus Microthrix sp.]|nr:hypothetical protein [Candidatus Microthrix sp.]